MSRRPSNADLERYLDGEHVAEVDSWLDVDASAAAELDSVVSSSDAEPLPKFIGKYPVERKLGEGGMGVVYLAHDDDLKRAVAVKKIRPQWASEPGFRERFIREGHLLAKVKGTHVVTVHNAGEHDGNPFLVMEYVEGIDFEKWLKANGTQNAAANVLWVAEQVLTGLQSIHEAGQGLIHRDIKPGNLWVTQGTIKIIDFGIAANAGMETQLCYSPGYAAPEVLDGGVPNEQSDLYSVGAVLYRMVADHPPPLGGNHAAKLQQLPTALRGFVLQLLDREPGKHPESAQAALTALAELKATPTPEQVELAELKAFRHRKLPSNPWVWLTVGLSASLGVLVAGWLLVRAEQVRIVDRVRATEVELDRGLDELTEAVKDLDAARAIDLHGKADAAARLKAAERFRDAMNRYTAEKARIDDARRTRAGLLDRLGSEAVARDKKE